MSWRKRLCNKHAVAGLAASVHGGPAVDFRDIGVCEDLERDERQHAADDNALYDVRDDGPSNEEGGIRENPPCFWARRTMCKRSITITGTPIQ